MFKDKITPNALRTAHSRIVAPFIIKTRPGKLIELALELEDFTRITGEVPSIFPRVLPFLSTSEIKSVMSAHPLKQIRRFNMLSALLPREVVFRLAENHNVEKIYKDKQMFAFRYPTVPPEGVFTAPHKITEEIRFTSTWWTKKLIGADIANSKGFYGDGIFVSVVDSGASRVHEQIRRVQFETTMPQYRDENGHGTWCVSCVGGEKMIDEYLSQRSGRTVYCEGMAPRCRLLAVKCLGYYIGTGMTSDIIDAMDLSFSRGADIISMSLGGASEETRPEDDPFYPVLEELVKSDVPVQDVCRNH